MAVNNATRIQQLIETTPTETNLVPEGAAELRALKAAVRGSFPNLGNTAVTATAEDLNSMAGAATGGGGLSSRMRKTGGDTLSGPFDFSNAEVRGATARVTDNSSLFATTSFVKEAMLQAAAEIGEIDISGKMNRTGGDSLTGVFNFANATITVPTQVITDASTRAANMAALANAATDILLKTVRTGADQTISSNTYTFGGTSQLLVPVKPTNDSSSAAASTKYVQDNLLLYSKKSGESGYSGAHSFLNVTSVEVPTASAGDNSKIAANTQFVTSYGVRFGLIGGQAWNGTQDFTGATVTGPTRTSGDNTANMATTQFVTAAIGVMGGKISKTGEETGLSGTFNFQEAYILVDNSVYQYKYWNGTTQAQVTKDVAALTKYTNNAGQTPVSYRMFEDGLDKKLSKEGEKTPSGAIFDFTASSLLTPTRAVDLNDATATQISVNMKMLALASNQLIRKDGTTAGISGTFNFGGAVLQAATQASTDNSNLVATTAYVKTLINAIPTNGGGGTGTGTSGIARTGDTGMTGVYDFTAATSFSVPSVTVYWKIADVPLADVKKAVTVSALASIAEGLVSKSGQASVTGAFDFTGATSFKAADRAAGDNSQEIANTKFVTTAVAAATGGVSGKINKAGDNGMTETFDFRNVDHLLMKSNAYVYSYWNGTAFIDQNVAALSSDTSDDLDVVNYLMFKDGIGRKFTKKGDKVDAGAYCDFSPATAMLVPTKTLDMNISTAGTDAVNMKMLAQAAATFQSSSGGADIPKAGAADMTGRHDYRGTGFGATGALATMSAYLQVLPAGLNLPYWDGSATSTTPSSAPTGMAASNPASTDYLPINRETLERSLVYYVSHFGSKGSDGAKFDFGTAGFFRVPGKNHYAVKWINNTGTGAFVDFLLPPSTAAALPSANVNEAVNIGMLYQSMLSVVSRYGSECDGAAKFNFQPAGQFSVPTSSLPANPASDNYQAINQQALRTALGGYALLAPSGSGNVFTGTQDFRNATVLGLSTGATTDGTKIPLTGSASMSGTHNYASAVLQANTAAGGTRSSVVATTDFVMSASDMLAHKSGDTYGTGAHDFTAGEVTVKDKPVWSSYWSGVAWTNQSLAAPTTAAPGGITPKAAVNVGMLFAGLSAQVSMDGSKISNTNAVFDFAAANNFTIKSTQTAFNYWNGVQFEQVINTAPTSTTTASLTAINRVTLETLLGSYVTTKGARAEQGAHYDFTLSTFFKVPTKDVSFSQQYLSAIADDGVSTFSQISVTQTQEPISAAEKDAVSTKMLMLGLNNQVSKLGDDCSAGAKFNFSKASEFQVPTGNLSFNRYALSNFTTGDDTVTSVTVALPGSRPKMRAASIAMVEAALDTAISRYGTKCDPTAMFDFRLAGRFEVPTPPAAASSTEAATAQWVIDRTVFFPTLLVAGNIGTASHGACFFVAENGCQINVPTTFPSQGVWRFQMGPNASTLTIKWNDQNVHSASIGNMSVTDRGQSATFQKTFMTSIGFIRTA